MTNQEYLTQKFPDREPFEIEFAIESAQAIYFERTKYEMVKPKHENWIGRCAKELLEKDGYSGSTGFSESGVSVSYDSSQISNSLLSEIPNNAVAFDKKGREIK